MKKILLGVTGSVAAVLTEKLVFVLGSLDYKIQIVATKPALYFFDWQNSRAPVWLDEHEWPPGIYHKDDPIKHIELRDWADLLLIAPLSANTLGKMANGICDNLLTSVVRAWDPKKPIVAAPAMNTKMWEHPATALHLDLLANWHKFSVVPPVEKVLACGDKGVGAMAQLIDIVSAVNTALGFSSSFKS